MKTPTLTLASIPWARPAPPRTRYGRLQVLGEAGQDRRRHRLWLCRCACGREIAVRASALRSGDIVSCGCLRRQRMRAAVTRHGRSGSPEYWVWQRLRGRPPGTVCAAWRRDFMTFYRAVGPRPSPRHWLLRSDPRGPFDAANCRWRIPPHRA